jgi:hypothetical protein
LQQDKDAIKKLFFNGCFANYFLKISVFKDKKLKSNQKIVEIKVLLTFAY